MERLESLNLAEFDSDLKNEVIAIRSCAAWADSWECIGELELASDPETDDIAWATEKKDRFDIPRLCGRPWCPKCGLYGSVIHQRREARVRAQVAGVRLGKWVVTMTIEDRSFIQDKEDIKSLKERLAKVLMSCHRVPAAFVIIHLRGDSTQGVHFEVLFPDSGRSLPRRELKLVRQEIGIQLDLLGLPVAKFRFIDESSESAAQHRMWNHRVRYAMHPTVPPEVLLKMPDDEARNLIQMRYRLETATGYGLWSKKKVNRAEARALQVQYPMPVFEDDKDGLDEWERSQHKLTDGGPCPACGQVLCYFMRPSWDGGIEISPGVNYVLREQKTENVVGAIDHATSVAQPIYWLDNGERRIASEFPAKPGAQRPIRSSKDSRFQEIIKSLGLQAQRDPGEDLEPSPLPSKSEMLNEFRLVRRWLKSGIQRLRAERQRPETDLHTLAKTKASKSGRGAAPPSRSPDPGSRDFILEQLRTRQSWIEERRQLIAWLNSARRDRNERLSRPFVVQLAKKYLMLKSLLTFHGLYPLRKKEWSKRREGFRSVRKCSCGVLVPKDSRARCVICKASVRICPSCQELPTCWPCHQRINRNGNSCLRESSSDTKGLLA